MVEKGYFVIIILVFRGVDFLYFELYLVIKVKVLVDYCLKFKNIRVIMVNCIKKYIFFLNIKVIF